MNRVQAEKRYVRTGMRERTARSASKKKTEVKEWLKWGGQCEDEKHSR